MQKSILTKHQVKNFEKEITLSDGTEAYLSVEIRHDDECGNGHNSFSMTGELYDRNINNGDKCHVLSSGKRRWLGSCGCLHDEITCYFPELKKYLKWHLCSTDYPMHYEVNTIYYAGNKERELDAARASAIWPEATDAELSVESEVLKMVLKARLPALMKAFKKDVEELGFIY
jgi:hypothetical protein